MSYVTQSNFTGTVNSILSTEQSNYNTLNQQIQDLSRRVQGISNRADLVDVRLNNPTTGLNAINKGLSQAAQDIYNIDFGRLNQIEDEITAIHTYIGMPQTTRSLTVTQQLAGQKYQGFDSSTILTNQINQLQQQQNDFFGNILAPLKALGTGLGIGTGVLLVGAGLLAVLALRK